MVIVVTGASGFVGGAVLEAAAKLPRVFVRAVFRGAVPAWDFANERVSVVVVPTLAASTDWSAALADANVVIHCASRVHVMCETESDPQAVFRAVNVDGTENLARQAAARGVRRFVFVSSIKVNGERTHRGRPYFAEDAPAPEDSYARSKTEAEDRLQQIARESQMEVVIIRPPLVYGPGVKGNFRTLVRLVARGLPFPLGRATDNLRSFVALDNLVDLMLTCVTHPKAGNQVFLVSDGQDISTAELLRRIGKALDRPARLIPVPTSWLAFVATALGKQASAHRLLGSLQADISKTRALLDWTPPISVDEGLRQLAKPGA